MKYSDTTALIARLYICFDQALSNEFLEVLRITSTFSIIIDVINFIQTLFQKRTEEIVEISAKVLFTISTASKFLKIDSK